MKMFLQRAFPCRSCKVSLPMKDFPPFTVVDCPTCGKETMVPGNMLTFWLYEFIDQGGMGAVYKAVAEGFPGELFAVKFLPEGRHDDPTCIEALHNEAQMMIEFHGHPNLVEAVEFGKDNGTYFLAVEFVEGERLDRLVADRGRLDEESVVDIGIDLLRVDKYLYRRGYIYRDMKPENIIVKPPNIPVVIDFGLCTTIHDAMYNTDSADVIGAPHFMPPERLTGAGENIFSEIYSIGMLMYFAATGRTFFESGDVQAVAEMYASEERTGSMLHHLPEISDEFKEIIDKMIQRDPRDRYQSYERVEDGLRALSTKLKRAKQNR